MGCMLDVVVDLVEERVDLDGSHFIWINSRTLVLCACFTTECGCPGIRKSMFASFTIFCTWLKFSWSITGLSVLSRSVLSPTLNVSLSWTERVWELSGTFSVFISITRLLVLSCAFSTLGSLLSSDERAWIPLVSITGLPVFSRHPWYRVSPRRERENVSLVQYQSNSFFPWEWFLMKSQQVLFFVVLLLPLIGMQNLSHPVLTHILQAELLEFMSHCCSNSSQTCLIHEKFWPRSEYCLCSKT